MPESNKEEYELIPMSPIRRLEKRIDKIESSSSSIDTREFLHEIIDIIRMNQQLVDELAKANDALRIELSRLPSRLEEVANSLNELISYIKASAHEESTAAPMSLQPLTDKLDKLIEGNKKVVDSNQSVVEALEEIDKKLRRPVIPLQRKPMQAPMPRRPIPAPV